MQTALQIRTVCLQFVPAQRSLPGGVAPAERAVGFEQDWAIIRSRPDVVLGGLTYAWATNGPEQLDRLFGLVDSQAVPTDGALAALSASYLADLVQTASGTPPT